MPNNKRQSPLLFVKAPELRQEFHETLNLGIDPEGLGISSQIKIWWKCHKGDDHIWRATPADRYHKKSGCGVCNGKVISHSRSIAHTHPEISASWHTELNGSLRPENVSAGSDKKVWWKCSKSNHHNWEARVKDRTIKNSGCPYCAGKRATLDNCIKTTHPKIAAQWHPTKNGNKRPDDFTIGSNIKIWWQCDKDPEHVWDSRIYSRLKSGCPMCGSGRMKRVVFSNSLAQTHPEIALEWHPKLNKIQPSEISYGYKGKVWWKCPKGPDHVWRSSVNGRTSINNHHQRIGRGCPICSGHKIVPSTSLRTTHPKLLDEWAYDLNLKHTPDKLSKGSHVKVWWRCKNDPEHTFQSEINNRTKGSNCPYCVLTPQSKQELTIRFELKSLFVDINPKGFKTRVDGKIWSIDIFIPSLNLGIEFDGNFWHKDKTKLDRLKTKVLKSSGFKILRVRQEPLMKLDESDIISALPFDPKKVVNDILESLLTMKLIHDNQLSDVLRYMRQKELINQKALERYINRKLKMDKAKK